jgi:hypothetical protein
VSFLTKLPEQLYPQAKVGRLADTTFDVATARALMWMSQLAYETDEFDKMQRILAAWGFDLAAADVVIREERAPLVVARTHCFVTTSGDTAIVAFAGTDPIDLANWITNFNARLGAAGSAEGYETAAAVAWPELKARLTRLPAGTRVFVTGHSLGGALAVLIARNIVNDQLAEVAAVYTFGMPRAGNEDFANKYNAALGPRTFRLVHGDDLVPTVAPSFLHFRHVGRFLHCDRAARFAASALEDAPGSDLPPFVETAVQDLSAALRGPLSRLASVTDRLALAASLAVGRGPAGLRTDPAGILIETLPPRIRDHIPDRYIAACGGP